MSFNDNVPQYAKALDDKISALGRERLFGIDWGHDCDCDFCDRDGEEADTDAEKKASKIDGEIKQVELTMKRLVRYALDNGIKLGDSK